MFESGWRLNQDRHILVLGSHSPAAVWVTIPWDAEDHQPSRYAKGLLFGKVQGLIDFDSSAEAWSGIRVLTLSLAKDSKRIEGLTSKYRSPTNRVREEASEYDGTFLHCSCFQDKRVYTFKHALWYSLILLQPEEGMKRVFSGCLTMVESN